MATQVIAAHTLGFGSRSNAMQAIEERNLSLLAAQQRAKRGPTPEMLFVKHLDNSRLVKADDPVRVREMRVFTAAMAVLFLFLMIYGWQHFSAIEYGYHIEAEKQQKELLEEQNRQLRLSEAELCDPVRIDRVAHKLGLGAPLPGQVVRPEGSFDSSVPVMAEASPAASNLR